VSEGLAKFSSEGLACSGECVQRHGAPAHHHHDVALFAQRSATSASSTRRFRSPSFTGQNCGCVVTNSDSRMFAISIEDLLVGISIKLQYTPDKRRYSNFDLLVTLNVQIIGIVGHISHGHVHVHLSELCVT
jgi:hypothetical protein